MKPVLIGTDDAITLLVGARGDREWARKQIYYWQSWGKITNHGTTGRYGARWCAHELLEVAREEGLTPSV